MIVPLRGNSPHRFLLPTFQSHSHICHWAFFFFQAEAGIRARTVTGVQTCALPISRTIHIRFGAVLMAIITFSDRPRSRQRDRKSVVEGKSVDLGGRGIIKKKKKDGGQGGDVMEADGKEVSMVIRRCVWG